MEPDLLTLQQRHERGVQALAALLQYWLGRSELGHEPLVAISSWGLGEASPLHKAVISRGRNARQVRGLGLPHLEALSAANEAIWKWKHDPAAAVKELGPFSSWKVSEQTLQQAVWLPDGEDPEKALSFEGFVSVLAGRLSLPYLINSEKEAEALSKQVGVLLDRLISERGWGPREGKERLLAAYQVSDRARQRRLVAVIVGDDEYGPDDLELEQHALSEMVRVVRGAKRYSPGELRAELLSGIHPRLG